jgi:hydroxyacylglutathione hydrolase
MRMLEPISLFAIRDCRPSIPDPMISVLVSGSRFLMQNSRRGISSVGIHSVPILSDNYSYLIVDSSTGIGACVDPGDALPIIKKVSEIQKKSPFQLKFILATHKHGDHMEGILELKERYPDMEVIGTGYEKIPGLTKEVFADDTFQIGNFHARTMYTPCHTSGHVCFHVQNSTVSLLFSGDTLFLGGCGRFFEGSPLQMLENMDQFLRLPSSTQIYCGHEYTLSNMKFLQHLYSDHPALLKVANEYMKKYENLRRENLPTIPSTIGDEMKYNGFLKCREMVIQEILGCPGDPIETMKKMRELKNNY